MAEEIVYQGQVKDLTVVGPTGQPYVVDGNGQVSAPASDTSFWKLLGFVPLSEVPPAPEPEPVKAKPAPVAESTDSGGGAVV